MERIWFILCKYCEKCNEKLFLFRKQKKKRFLFVEMCLYCYICMSPGVLDMSVTILVHILATVFAKDTLLTGG